MTVCKVEKEIAGRTLSIETGKLAKQASGAVVVQYEDTMVLVAVVGADPRPGIDFFPLTVDYREKTAAAGKFPGGFMKREGRPTTKEILTMRMIDRPIRPLFPKGYFDEVQIQAMVLSADKENNPDVLAMIGASAALAISNIPFNCPLGAVRVGCVDDEFVIYPTHSQMENSSLELVLGGHADEVNMIEVAAHELSEDKVAEAIEAGHEVVKDVCAMISDLTAQAGQEKQVFESPDTSELVALLEEKVGDDYRQAKQISGKLDRYNKVKEIFEGFIASVCPEDVDPKEHPYTPEMIRMGIEDFKEATIRALILDNKRDGGRGYEEIRELSGEVTLLPRTHGSALFTRGETQAIVSCTLGTTSDEQTIDGLIDEYGQRFMLHYNFPPFCVGEARRIMGPGRREIGHGALAEKSLAQVIPDKESFPYTVKLVSEILESNGSSSMASVCAGTLALMDAGVPIKHPVAGISIGMITRDDGSRVLITDILGEEDHYGDMDFKVAGTQKGITGVQLDLKASGISYECIRETFERAKVARMEILKTIVGVIDRPRKELSVYAPKITTIKIPVDMIGAVIGPGGREVKKIQESAGVKVEIEDDGTVLISCTGGNGHLKAKEMIEMMTMPMEVGKTYSATVVSVKDFGAFLELAPGKEGLCHVSELSTEYIKSVADVCNIGDEMKVKIIAIDAQGRIKLSRKAVMREEDSDDN